MRAVIHTEYGGPEVLRLADMPKPVPADHELLVRVHATTVNRSDCGARSGTPFFARAFSGLRRPRKAVLGTEFAGAVEAVGSAVSSFAPGDLVFGVNAWRYGTHADYVCVKESAPVALKPTVMSFQEAAAVCDGVILALTCLRNGDVGPGQNLLIYGASGSIGTAAVQLAHHLGATVTAVCTTKNVDLIRSLGADEVIDYTVDDYRENGKTYDVIFDAVGKSVFSECRDSLVPGGRFITTDLGRHYENVWLSASTRWGRNRVTMPIPKYRKIEVELLKRLIEDGHYRAVIDRTYPLEDVVEATTYVESEQKTGNVVLTLTSDDDRS